ncbi:probable G-protein coupled receptor Mth-like 8 isoform X3 [Glossina fuscipes]|uniref:Probable G-protein coupled receptor Mth-like 8 isoform X3 n=1 Tax=Glossina fuscipes TaxID=7396 RepID=A0A8U0W5C3_9MUSC|nr:probable G-protein coupled receptor Mth-like 8 isoform X3 [Glossina fuscipes]
MRANRVSALIMLSLAVAFNVFPLLALAQNSQASSKYPCAFIDTVNITGSYPHEQYGIGNNSNAQHINNSYIYEWMIIPPELVAVYDFIIKNGIRVQTERHLRACVCKLKPCIRFCCSQGFFYSLENKSCSPISSIVDNFVDQDFMEIRFTNGSIGTISTSGHFLVHHGTPCEHMRTITKDNHYVHWTLHENGTIAYKNHLFSKHYCFSAFPESNKDNEMDWQWQPLACVPERLPFILGVREWTYAIFGYSLLAHLTLTNPANMSKYACSKIPSFALLYLVLSFYILSFISFNFYLSFFGIILSNLMFWFIFFPIVIIAACWSFFVSFDLYNNRPVFGNEICWFDPRNWSILVYLYVPILLSCVFSGIFYILSLIKLSDGPDIDVNKLMASVSRNRFKSFWKFFGYTLSTWLVCMCSFAINCYRGERTHINYVVCLFIAIHGFGSLYALVGKNQQIQNFLRKIEEEIDSDEIAEISMPMSNF